MTKLKKNIKPLNIILALLLLIAITFSFTACFFGGEDENTTTTLPAPETTTATTSAPTQATLPDETTTKAAPVYTEKQETVYATVDVNIRQQPNTNSAIVGKLHEGNSITRLAKGSDGWSKVQYGNGICYIYSKYLIDKEPQRVSSNRIIVEPKDENWNLIVVNTTREIPAGYTPKLAEIGNTGVYLDYRVAPHYNDMYDAAKQDGIILTPFSGYRSYARQERNYNNLTDTYMSRYGISREEAAKKAATVILPPGTSEHNLGLAMDICNTNDSFKNQKEYAWLQQHAHEYGFILRYTAEKQPVTGIVPEPWHWRYVGVEYAEKIKNSGLCLEEYLDSIGVAY